MAAKAVVCYLEGITQSDSSHCEKCMEQEDKWARKWLDEKIVSEAKAGRKSEYVKS